MFWGAFLLFSITTASIISGSIIERVRSGAFWIIAVLIGSVMWILDAAWGWHPQGWMVKLSATMTPMLPASSMPSRAARRLPF